MVQNVPVKRNATSGRRRSWYCVAFSVLLAAAWLSVADARSSAASPIVVSLNFDNNLANQYTLGFQNALQPAGVSATFFVNSGTVGTSNKLSWAQVNSLAASGDEIGSKTVDGISLTTLSTQQQISEICDDRQNILAHGITPIAFAYPSGANNSAIQSEAQSCGYGNARTAGGLSPSGATYAETLPPRSWLALRAYAPSGQVTLANLESLVSGAASHDGGWIPIVIQRVCSSALDPADYSTCTSSAGWIDLGDLQTFITWVQNAGQASGAPAGTVFRTMGTTINSADTGAPATSIACNGSPCQSATYNQTVYVTLPAIDLGSGTASTHYTLNGSVPTQSSPAYTGRFPLTSSTTVEYRSWDNAGNAEAAHSQVVSVVEPPDATPPVTTIACNGTSCQYAPYFQPVTVTLNAADNSGGWGVANTFYTTDGSTPTTSSTVYSGSFTIHGPTVIKFFSTDLAGNAEQVNTQRITDQTVVSLTFDDQYEDQWLYAVPLMRALNMTGTFFVITSDTDAGFECCMSWSQLDTLQAEGDDIGSHTVDHPDLTTLSVAQMTSEICGSRQDMISHGITDPQSFAYPFGDFNSTVQSVVQQCGFNNARVGGGISNSNFTPTAPFIETIPPKDPYALRTIAVDGANPENLADLESFVDAAAAHGGGWLPLTLHDVCDANADDFSDCMSKYGSIQDTVLAQFLDWLAAAGRPGGAPAGVVVKNVCQVMNCP
ncbi:MAG TPA: polysaccharide deacetylase family protein [Streptosporangiaceae bacterium]|nr:polysaccharide deacetylase family protein [Streptosporangiaceae bacterium]